MGIQERFSQTDRALEEVPTWPNVSCWSLSSWLVFLISRSTDLWQTPKLSPQAWPARIPQRPSSRNWNSKYSTKCLGKSVDWISFRIKYLRFLSCRVKVREGRFGELTEILAWYEYINDVILDHLDDEIKSTNKSGVWRYLISFKVSHHSNISHLFSLKKNLLRAIENIGIVSVYGIRYLTTGNVTQPNFIK